MIFNRRCFRINGLQSRSDYAERDGLYDGLRDKVWSGYIVMIDKRASNVTRRGSIAHFFENVTRVCIYCTFSYVDMQIIRIHFDLTRVKLKVVDLIV